MARRTKEDAERTRSCILDAAEKIFYENNAENASLSVIAEEAGVTRGAIYGHFKNRHDILAAIQGRSLVSIEIITGLVHPSRIENPLEHLKTFFSRALCLIVKSEHRHTIFDMMLNQCRLFHESRATPAHPCGPISSMNVYVRSCIDLAVGQRQLSRHYDVPFAQTAVSAVFVSMLGDLLRLSQSASLEAAAEKAADFLVNMLKVCPADRDPA